MLKLIIGRASAGKTTYVRKILSDCINAGREVILIVPEQFSFESEKAVIEMLGPQKADNAKIMSFSSLSKKILDEYVPNRKPPVTDAAKAVIMSIALESLSENLDIFGKCAKNKNTVSELLRISDEMIQCEVSPLELLKAAELSGNSILRKKTDELTQISQMYETLLTERFSDDRYMINSAAKTAAEKKLFSEKTIIFDAFTGFTAQEYLLVSEMLTQADDVYVTQCAESIKDLSEGTGAFAYAVMNISKLMAVAKKNNVRIAEPVVLKGKNVYASEAIAAIEAGLYLPVPEIYTEDAPEITVAAATNPYEECEYVAMMAKKLVREEGLRYRDIVVVGRNSDYQKYLPFAFNKYDIPMFEDTRRSLKDEIIVRYASSALSLAAEGFSSDCVFRLLKTYISPISDDDISMLENYVFTWQIDYSGWLREWTGHPDGFGNEETEESSETLKRINEIREAVVFPILNLKKNMENCDGFTATKALYDYLIETGSDRQLLCLAEKLENTLACECERSWDEFMSALSLLADTIGERKISSTRYLELFNIMMLSSDMGELPGGLDIITVGNADRIRVTDKKVLFIVGANEGIFPAGSSSSFVLTENERHILRNQGIELNEDGIEKAQKERLRVYSTISIPREKLYICYSLGDFSGSSLAPSEIVTQAERIVPKLKKTEISMLSPESTVESRQSAFECGAKHYSDNTVFSESVKEYIRDMDIYKDKLASVERSVNKKAFVFENSEKSTALFGKNMYITPSGVEEYYKCPFRYFCRYGIRAKPLQKAFFDPRQNGLIVHFVLEKMFSKYGSKGLTELNEDECKSEISGFTDDYVDKQMGGQLSMDKRSLYSIKRCKDSVFEILQRLTFEFSDSKFETKDVELKIGSDGEIPSYVLNIPDGGKIMLSGIVDRVDTMDSDGKNYLRIIDYKTGSKEFKLSDVMSGLNIQMLVYLMCLFENGKDRYGNIVPAGILYVPAKKGKNELPRNASEEDANLKRSQQGRMNGIVLGDSEVISGMEKDCGGMIINASIDKNGNIKGSTFTMEQFKLLHKAVDNIAVNMAESLHKGNVKASPVIEGNYQHTCSYCDYKNICCREDGDEYTPLFKGDVWETLEETNNE